MDDYSKEIADLQAQIEEMEQEAEPDREHLADLRMQGEILKLMYFRAQEVYAAGEAEPELRTGLTLHGYGDWDFDNVYAFVFEKVTELPAEGHHSFVGEIKETDFVSMLR